MTGATVVVVEEIKGAAAAGVASEEIAEADGTTEEMRGRVQNDLDGVLPGIGKGREVPEAALGSHHPRVGGERNLRQENVQNGESHLRVVEVKVSGDHHRRDKQQLVGIIKHGVRLRSALKSKSKADGASLAVPKKKKNRKIRDGEVRAKKKSIPLPSLPAGDRKTETRRRCMMKRNP